MRSEIEGRPASRLRGPGAPLWLRSLIIAVVVAGYTIVFVLLLGPVSAQEGDGFTVTPGYGGFTWDVDDESDEDDDGYGFWLCASTSDTVCSATSIVHKGTFPYAQLNYNTTEPGTTYKIRVYDCIAATQCAQTAVQVGSQIEVTTEDNATDFAVTRTGTQATVSWEFPVGLDWINLRAVSYTHLTLPTKA